MYPACSALLLRKLTDTCKSDINALILDYLTVAGYPNAAAKFSSEANLPPQQPAPYIQIRQKIQRLIHKGEIENAIQELNAEYPSVCSKRLFSQ
jgi:glucose-induced degradation protein 8